MLSEQMQGSLLLGGLVKDKRRTKLAGQKAGNIQTRAGGAAGVGVERRRADVGTFSQLHQFGAGEGMEFFGQKLTNTGRIFTGPLLYRLHGIQVKAKNSSCHSLRQKRRYMLLFFFASLSFNRFTVYCLLYSVQ